MPSITSRKLREADRLEAHLARREKRRQEMKERVKSVGSLLSLPVDDDHAEEELGVMGGQIYYPRPQRLEPLAARRLQAEADERARVAAATAAAAAQREQEEAAARERREREAEAAAGNVAITSVGTASRVGLVHTQVKTSVEVLREEAAVEQEAVDKFIQQRRTAAAIKLQQNVRGHMCRSGWRPTTPEERAARLLQETVQPQADALSSPSVDVLAAAAKAVQAAIDTARQHGVPSTDVRFVEATAVLHNLQKRRADRVEELAREAERRREAEVRAAERARMAKLQSDALQRLQVAMREAESTRDPAPLRAAVEAAIAAGVGTTDDRASASSSSSSASAASTGQQRIKAALALCGLLDREPVVRAAEDVLSRTMARTRDETRDVQALRDAMRDAEKVFFAEDSDNNNASSGAQSRAQRLLKEATQVIADIEREDKEAAERAERERVDAAERAERDRRQLEAKDKVARWLQRRLRGANGRRAVRQMQHTATKMQSLWRGRKGRLEAQKQQQVGR